MGGVISLDYFLIPILEIVMFLFDVVPYSRFWTYSFIPTGLVKLVVHRTLLEKNNLYKSKS